jgi:hypothetical protein
MMARKEKQKVRGVYEHPKGYTAAMQKAFGKINERGVGIRPR